MELGFFFYFGGVWEDVDGIICFDVVLLQDVCFVDGGVYVVMCGELVVESDSQMCYSFVMLCNGCVLDVQVFSIDFVEFLQVDMCFIGC